MKRRRIKEVALAVLLREGLDSETAERLADMIALEPISTPPTRSGLDRLERVLTRATEPH